MIGRSLNDTSSQRLPGRENEFILAQPPVQIWPSRDDDHSGKTLCFPGSTNSNINIPEASSKLHPEIMFKQTFGH